MFTLNGKWYVNLVHDFQKNSKTLKAMAHEISDCLHKPQTFMVSHNTHCHSDVT